MSGSIKWMMAGQRLVERLDAEARIQGVRRLNAITKWSATFTEWSVSIDERLDNLTKKVDNFISA